ncbi:MAG TPA: twin-arginine translocase subunit TatC [Gammaproteobacteria bacterium]|jgi:sec-independent protein translocase protein TatC|nr:twin-arginine translocase subunit TatC [Gammaproteobacteria bacterium]
MSQQPDNHEQEEQLAEGTLMSHLLELRSRIMKATVAVVVVFLALTPFTQRVFEVVSAPLIAVLPAGSEMIATDVAAPFLTPFKTTFYVALFLAMPIVLFQVWQFVAPGLYKREKRFAIPLIVSSIVLFYTGMAFAYFVVFRLMFSFFAKMVPGGVVMAPDISSYLSFVLGIFLAFGVAFEVPIATVMLIWSGLVSIQTLKSGRRYAFLGAFVIGAVLTPPDVFSQTLLAVPMYLLYEGGLIMARVLLPEKTKQ